MSIFVQITSYKNFDIIPTIKDCINKCSDRNNLYFGVCLQQDEPVPVELSHPRIKTHLVSPSESLGPGWARSKAQSFYEGQDYVLQIDSGSRFADNWDVELIGALSSTGTPKPIISNFPNRYNPSNGEMEQPSVSYKTQIYSFSQYSVLSWPSPMKNVTSISRSVFLNDNFFFAQGQHCRECPYDPSIYSSELESYITLKSFTHGYEFFSHFKPVVWKDYSPRPAHWQDDPNWWVKDITSKETFSSFSEGKTAGIGNVKSIRDFELYSGIDFKNKRIQRATTMGGDPPCNYENEEKWNGDFIKDYSATVSWDTNEIEKCDDYDYWYFAIEDDAENTLHRQDLRVEQDAELLSFKKNYKKIAFRIVGGKTPKKLCVWPVSKSKGWLKKSKFDLSLDAI